MIPVRYNLRSLLERRATSLMTVLGLGMVATIFVIPFGFIGGLKRTILNAGVRTPGARYDPPHSASIAHEIPCNSPTNERLSALSRSALNCLNTVADGAKKHTRILDP